MVDDLAVVDLLVDDFDAAVARAKELQAEIIMPRHRNPPDGDGGPNHWELWLRDLDGYKVVLASPDGEDADVFGYHYASQMLAVNLFHMRGGRVLDRREFFWEDLPESAGPLTGEYSPRSIESWILAKSCIRVPS